MVKIVPLNDTKNHPEPVTHEVVEDYAGRGLVLRVTTSFLMDGATLAQKLYEHHAHDLDNDTDPDVNHDLVGYGFPEYASAEDVMRVVSDRQAECGDGWHSSMNEPSHESHEAAEKFAKETVLRLFPNLAWNVERPDDLPN